MTYIKYSEKTDWDRNLLDGAYKAYFDSKLEALQTKENKKALESMKKAKIWADTINGQQIMINEEDIARAATSKLSGYASDIATVYQGTLKAISSTQQIFDEAYSTAAANIVKGIQLGWADGIDFKIDLNSSTALDLKKAAINTPVYVRGGISNTLGDVGEGISALAGRAITEALIEQFEKQLNSTNAINKKGVKAVYQNKGQVRSKNYRSQTDNELQISFSLNPEVINGEVANLNFTYKISDKANSALAELTDKTKTTDKINIRNSSVGHLLKNNPQGKEAIYNTISYHKDLNGNRYPGIKSKGGNALRAYAGYKLLLDTFIESQKHDDEINFTVYGNKIIPENTVVQHMLEKTRIQQLKTGGTRGGNYRYMAEIRYWMLVTGKGENQRSTVRSIAQAEKLIRSMPVQIGSSFQI